jgi:mono/diheme cytochrome c family protein
MTRVEITVGLLAVVASIFIIALVGLGEPARMPKAETGFQQRRAETGALLFDQYCGNCHGQNAGGGMCPPLNETSGLYGGDIGEGVAWRLEELGWDRNGASEYIVSTIASGRTISTRPGQYPGNRVEGAGPVMAMPAWSQRAGGPLRDDQIADIATYLTNFRKAIPDDPAAALKVVGTPPPTAVPAAGATGAVTSTTGVTATLALAPSVDLTAGDATKGEALFKSATCVACHALPGVSEAKVGPNMAGLFARAGTEITGSAYQGQAKTAEEYIYESIRNPNAFVVEAFAVNGKSPMVLFGPERLSDQDIADLIAYLKQAGG